MPLTAPTMHYFTDHYTPNALDRLDWRASPATDATLPDRAAPGRPHARHAMHGKLIGASRRIVDFVAAAIGAQLHDGEPVA